MDDNYALTPGCRYTVHHGEENVTEGVLKGISVMGAGTALVFQLDDGTFRYISHASIEYMDLRGGEPSIERAVTEGNAYYG